MGAGGGGGGGGGEKRKYVILTDSNGRKATAHSILNHVPSQWREIFDIQIEAVYTTEEAFSRVGRGEVDVRNAVVIIDVLTNDVRGTRQRPAVSPEDLVWRVDMLRRRLREAGAKASIVCQLKPMEVADVTVYNTMLDDYLRAQGGQGYGCRTQVRRQYLKRDGFHILPQFDSIIDRTYACALLGWEVPCPTPHTDFAPESSRRRYRTEWPSLVRSDGGQRIGVEGPWNRFQW